MLPELLKNYYSKVVGLKKKVANYSRILSKGLHLLEEGEEKSNICELICFTYVRDIRKMNYECSSIECPEEHKRSHEFLVDHIMTLKNGAEKISSSDWKYNLDECMKITRKAVEKSILHEELLNIEINEIRRKYSI